MKRLFYSALLMLLVGYAHAQTHISGTVLGVGKNTNEPIPGANVYWQGTTIAVATDSVGNFHLPLPADTSSLHLITSMLGFVADTILVEKPYPQHLQVALKSTVTLDEVTVETRQSTTMYSTFNPINTEVISSKELLKAACCNLSESFSTNASVDVAFTDAVSGAKKIQMLGLDGIYTQVLSENIPLMRGLSASYGLNYIPGTWIKNIMVTKGTGSVVNGYESISGQINLDFLKPEEQKAPLFINLYANLKSRAELNVHYTPKINDKWATMLFVHTSDLSNRNDMNHDTFLDMPLTRQYNVFNRWEYHNNKNLEAQFGIKALMENRQAGQTNFNYKTDFGTTNAYGIGINTKSLEYFSKTGFLFPATPYKSIGIQTAGKLLERDMYFGLRNYKGEQKNFYANVIYANILSTTDHKYKVGASYLLDDYSERYKDSAFSRTESVPGLFAEYTYTHAENISLVAGFRTDYHNMFGMQYTPRLHVRYNPLEKTTLRLSAGRGFRTANAFVENQTVFASSRQVIITETFKPEIAWNYGLSINQKFVLFDEEAFINIDFFRTDFQNQVVMDLDKHVNQVWFYNLNGVSYSNSMQMDVAFMPFERAEVKMAGKWYDVQTTYHGQLLDKPYIPKYRLMFNAAYSTYMDIWKFDFTTNWFGKGRIPNTSASPAKYRLSEYSKEYFVLNAQVTKKFRKFETYLGVENMLNYTQKNPIIAADTPFSPNFDASMLYAPIEGRIIYAGLRIEIK